MPVPHWSLTSRFRSPWTAAAVHAAIAGVLYTVVMTLLDGGLSAHTLIGTGIFVAIFVVFSGIAAGGRVRRGRDEHGGLPRA